MPEPKKGRPASINSRTVMVNFRLTTAEADTLRALAQERGVPMAELVRDFVEFGVNVGFSQEEAQRLHQLAKERGKPVAELVRTFVDYGVKKLRGEVD